MKLVSVTLLLTLTAVQGFPFLGEFMEWKEKHGKSYPTVQEELRRMLVYLDNWAFVHKYNSQSNRKMTLGMNEYADLTHEEFKSQMLGTRMETTEWGKLLNEISEQYQPPLGYTAPNTMDWRQKGAVTRVKNQGACGSCYSFSTTGSIEGQWFLSKGKLVELSEQQIMDCSSAYGNTPCQGGLMSNSFRYIINAGGIETEASYPYQGEGGYCQFDQSVVAATIRSFTRVSPSESYLKMASAREGPISVGIDASQRSFQLYKEGVYDEPACTSQIDHAVLVVGYGTDSVGGDYWLVKNSWGTNWGEDGYVRMSRNNENMCGIANMASFPVV